MALSFWLIIKADDPRVQVTVDRAPLQAWWLLQPFGGWQLDGEKMSLWESEPSVGLINAGGNSNIIFHIQPDPNRNHPICLIFIGFKQTTNY